MFRVRILYVYFFAACLATAPFVYAMEQEPKPIDRKKIGELLTDAMRRVEAVSEVGVSPEASVIIQQEAAIIAQEARMPDRTRIIAASMVMGKYQSDYAKREPDFAERHAQSQQKDWERRLPYYVCKVPYDCTVIVKKKNGKNEIDIGEYHTMHANKYSIKDAQDVILPAIRDYARLYTKNRPDGRLNPGQPVECTILFGDSPSDTHTFNSCAGDAWQAIEEKMTDHLKGVIKIN